MDLIIDFYKELDTLNLIIFWGIIIVIILLLIFSFILINKNKKLKKMVEQNNKYEEEIPIKEKIETEKDIETLEETLIPVEEKKQEEESSDETLEKTIEVENHFIVEEHIAGYSKDTNNVSNNKINEETTQENTKNEFYSPKTIEIPNKPYQRNVLREMSLSQTSPIGINRTVQTEDRKKEMIRDLDETLNNNEFTNQQKKEIINEPKLNHIEKKDETAEKELHNTKNTLTRTTAITPGVTESNEHEPVISENKKIVETKYYNNQLEAKTKTTLNNQQIISTKEEKNSSEKYLEEVSRKLAEAEIPDEIERTNYELQQEEDAIISYKELMEKKDSIQTIDEEDAIISIEELMNRNNQHQESSKEEQKLYNLTEEEANDNFIKELKQFRNDL